MMKFSDYTKGFRNTAQIDKRNRAVPATPPKPFSNIDAETKRRQIVGQIAGITQELLNLPELSDTDRRLLNISGAVAYLLAGR
jgi:hypothetical protein